MVLYILHILLINLFIVFIVVWQQYEYYYYYYYCSIKKYIPLYASLYPYIYIYIYIMYVIYTLCMLYIAVLNTHVSLDNCRSFLLLVFYTIPTDLKGVSPHST